MPEAPEQYVARRLVNAFTDRWYQHYAAERLARLEAMERAEASSGETIDNSLDAGSVVQAEKRRRLRSQSPEFASGSVGN